MSATWHSGVVSLSRNSCFSRSRAVFQLEKQVNCHLRAARAKSAQLLRSSLPVGCSSTSASLGGLGTVLAQGRAAATPAWCSGTAQCCVAQRCMARHSTALCCETQGHAAQHRTLRCDVLPTPRPWPVARRPREQGGEVL